VGKNEKIRPTYIKKYGQNLVVFRMVLNIKFIFFGQNKLWKNHEFEEIIIFMLRIMRKTSKEMHLSFIQKKTMSTIKD
jgi:branched-subunit amino acid transport protein AzlD